MSEQQQQSPMGASERFAAVSNLLDATNIFFRHALEEIADSAGVDANAAYGPKPNGVLLMDIVERLEVLKVRDA